MDPPEDDCGGVYYDGSTLKQSNHHGVAKTLNKELIGTY